MKAIKQKQCHSCPKFKSARADCYGPAVDQIVYDEKDQEWWMDNGEYATGPIFSCPFCGEKLEQEQIDVTESG